MPSFEWAHRNTIQPLSLQMNVGDVLCIHPRVPLFDIDPNDHRHWDIKIVEMRVTQPQLGVRSVEPLNERSKQLIRDWTDNYGSMSDADFDWLPSL